MGGLICGSMVGHFWTFLLKPPQPLMGLFLDKTGLHLNHCIASCAANYDWPFRTLPFGFLRSNLDTKDLETYPKTYSGHF